MKYLFGAFGYIFAISAHADWECTYHVASTSPWGTGRTEYQAQRDAVHACIREWGSEETCTEGVSAFECKEVYETQKKVGLKQYKRSVAVVIGVTPGYYTNVNREVIKSTPALVGPYDAFSYVDQLKAKEEIFPICLKKYSADWCNYWFENNFEVVYE